MSGMIPICGHCWPQLSRRYGVWVTLGGHPRSTFAISLAANIEGDRDHQDGDDHGGDKFPDVLDVIGPDWGIHVLSPFT